MTLLFPAPPIQAQVTVRLRAGVVDVTARGAPLSEVLDALARPTGMKVVYDGPAPRQLVTVSLRERWPAQAVLDLLEGQGLNYVLVRDTAGTGVQSLVLVAVEDSPPPRASAARADSGAEPPEEEPANPDLDGIPAALRPLLPPEMTRKAKSPRASPGAPAGASPAPDSARAPHDDRR